MKKKLFTADLIRQLSLDPNFEILQGMLNETLDVLQRDAVEASSSDNSDKIASFLISISPKAKKDARRKTKSTNSPSSQAKNVSSRKSNGVICKKNNCLATYDKQRMAV